MLKNYFEINENETIMSFLKNLNDKKNTQYLILEGGTNAFVDIRTIAMKLHRSDEKLKSLKKPLSSSKSGHVADFFAQLVASGDRVIKVNDGYFDFLDGLKYILDKNFDFLENRLDLVSKKEIFALNLDDKISQARSLFIKNKINILPIIEGKKLIGELRPMDLLVNSLFTDNSNKKDYYNENYDSGVFNLPIENLGNNKPITLQVTSTFKDAVEKMIEKKLPSIIVILNDDLYTVVSYKDVFKNVLGENIVKNYMIEYNGVSDLYEDDLDLIEDLSEKTMKKISEISNYDLLKISFKTHGNTQGSHKKKSEINLVLSHGNKIIHIDKEILGGTSDELSNDKVKQRWNTPLMIQETLKILEKKVKEERRKS